MRMFYFKVGSLGVRVGGFWVMKCLVFLVVDFVWLVLVVCVFWGVCVIWLDGFIFGCWEGERE